MKISLLALMNILLAFSAIAASDEKANRSIPPILSLKDSCLLALKHNPAVNSMRERASQQEGLLTEAKARSRPRLLAAANYETFDSDRLQNFGSDVSPDSTRWNGSLNAELTVFSGGRNYQYIKSEQARLKSIGSSVSSTEEELLILVHSAYYGSWLANERVKVQQEAISVFEEQLKITRNKFNAGSGEKYDVTQAEVSLANARPPLIRAQNDKRRSIDRLQEIIGLPYSENTSASDIKIDPMPITIPKEVTLKNAITDAMKNRFELQGAEHDSETAQRQVTLVKRVNSPIVDLFAGYAIESDMFGASTSLEGWSTGVRLNWTLLDGGMRRGQVEQAWARVRQVQYHTTELELVIEGQVRKAYYDQLEASSILQASEKVIGQAREALSLAQNRYKAGQGTQLDVLESQLQLTKAQLEHSTARHDLELASVLLKRATGSRIIEH